jgi:hypothetical protein
VFAVELTNTIFFGRERERDEFAVELNNMIFVSRALEGEGECLFVWSRKW